MELSQRMFIKRITQCWKNRGDCQAKIFYWPKFFKEVKAKMAQKRSGFHLYTRLTKPTRHAMIMLRSFFAMHGNETCPKNPTLFVN